MDKSKFVYKCEKCEKKFRYRCRLKEHEELLHSGKLFKCSKCDREFKRKSTRDLHEHTHKEDFEWHECELCERKFTTSSGLGNHIQAVHNEGLEGNHHCVFCERGLINVRDFERHLRAHIQEKPYICNKCGNELSCQYSLASHGTIHQPKEERPRPFKCNRCPKNYFNARGLRLHIRITHLKLKEFKCKLCEKKFGTPGGLREHIKTHTGERPYPCTVCSKKFTGSGDLKKHLRTHTGERRFPCKVCSKRFSGSGVLKKHLVVHTRERPYPCSYCKKAFCRNSVRTIHERNIHGK